LSRYQSAWGEFLTFLSVRQLRVAEVTVVVVADFLSYLFDRGFAGSTIAAYSSALAFFLVWEGLPDVMFHPVVTRMVAGARRLRPVADSRAPLSRAELFALCDAVSASGLSAYDTSLFHALLLCGFFALLRLSELVGKHAVRVDDVVLRDNSFLLRFRSFKHKASALPESVAVHASGDTHCPVLALQRFLQRRLSLRSASVFLFCFESGRPVTVRFFTNWFRALVRSVLPAGRAPSILPHSLRIGGATDAMLAGFSVLKVQQLGRWRSTAFYNYIRPRLLPPSII
jgi:site-specific recombinase XerD